MPGEKRARRKPVHAWYDRDYATSQHGSIDRQALMLSNKPTRRTPDDPPLQQGLVEMATVGAQSVLWLVLAGAILAAVAGAAVIAWSLRPVPLYLSERVKRGSPFDVEFWIRIAEAGVRIAHVPSVWSGFRRHASSKTVAEKGRFWREERHIRRDHGGKFFSRALYLHYAYPVYHPVYAATKRLRVLRPLVIRLRRFARKRRRFARY